MLSLLVWFAILSACFAFGAALLARLRARPDGLAEEFPLAVALGMGALSLLMLGIGLLGWLQAWVGIVLVCLLGFSGCRHLVRLARQLAAGLGAVRGWRLSMIPLTLFFAAAGAMTLIGTLAPATEADYDGLFYHLAIPKLYLIHGRIHPLPWLSHSNFPFNLEMLYLLGLMLRDQALAKLFHFGCAWLTALALYAFGRRLWGPRAGSLAAALFVGMPLISWEATSAYNELAFALYAFLALVALGRGLEGERCRRGWLAASALLCGLALGTKMLAGTVLVFALLAIAWAWWTQRPRVALAGPLLLYLMVAAAVAAPWYLKSYLWTGNPVYPFCYDVFGGRWWTPERAREYTAAQREFGLGTGPLAFFLLPWNLTMHARWFFDLPQQLRPISIMIWVYGPLLLAFLPTLISMGPVGGAGRGMLWFAFIYTAVWFLLSQNGRYLIPILPCLCACGGLAASRLLDRRGLLASTAALALGLGLASGLYAAWGIAAPAARVAVGRESPQQFLLASSGIYRMLKAVSRATPPDARLMVLGDEPRLFYLDRDYLLGNHAAIFSARDLASAAALQARLRQMGITHLLIHQRTQADIAARRGAIETRLADLQQQGSLRLIGVYGTLSLWQLGDASE